MPKIGVRWLPIDDSLALRASWSKGFRQPSLYELFSTPTAGLTPITHPLTKVNEPEQDVTVAGNRRLAAEKTRYTNVGFVWSPQAAALKGLTIGVDYWDVNRTGTVTNNYQDTVNRFFGRAPGAAAGSAPGGLLPGESVVLFPNGDIKVVNSVFFNIGETKVAGLDYSLNYVLKTDRLGRFEFSTIWSQYTHYLQRSAAGGQFYELVNQATGGGTGSDDGYLRWRGRTELNWSYRGLSAGYTATYTDGFWDVDGNTGNDFFVSPTWISDLQVGYNFQNKFGAWLADTKLTVGVRNVFDRNPPFASGNAGNSTGYPGFLYSSEGRFWYVSLNRKF